MPNDQIVKLIMTMFKEKDIAWWSAEDFRKMLEGGGLSQAAYFKPLVEAQEQVTRNSAGLIFLGIVLLLLALLRIVNERYSWRAKVMVTFSTILSLSGMSFYYYQQHVGLQLSERNLVTSVALQPTNLKTMVRSGNEWKKVTKELKANFSSQDVYPGADLASKLTAKDLANMVHDQVTTLKWIELTFKYKDDDLIFKHRKFDDEGKKVIEEKVNNTLMPALSKLTYIESGILWVSIISLIAVSTFFREMTYRQLFLLITGQAFILGLLMTFSVTNRELTIPKAYQEVYDFTTEELLKVEKPLESE